MYKYMVNFSVCIFAEENNNFSMMIMPLSSDPDPITHFEEE